MHLMCGSRVLVKFRRRVLEWRLLFDQDQQRLYLAAYLRSQAPCAQDREMLTGILSSNKKKDEWKASLETLQAASPVTRSGHVGGADGKTSGEEYAIYHAVHKGNLKELQDKLKESAVHINQRDALGNTALHFACANGNGDIASVLLDNGADASAQNNVGMSPLHEAAQAGHAALVRKLLKCGAEPQLKRADGASAYDLAEAQDVLDILHKHAAAQQTQLQTSSKAVLPVQTRVVLNLLSSPFLVPPNSIHFGACWLGSDRHVVVCEQALGKVAVIKLPGGGTAEGSGEAGSAGASSVAVSRIALNAETAMLNPGHDLLTWKDGAFIHVRSLGSEKDTKLLKLQDEVSFWKWVDSSTIALVTDTAVLHWAMDSAQPVRVFPLAPELKGAQVISYQATADGKCFLLGAVLVKAGGAIEGIMQLFSAAAQTSEILHGHCGIFAAVTLPGAGRCGLTNVLVYEEKARDESTSLRIREVGRDSAASGESFSASSPSVSGTTRDASKADFPVTMTYSAAHGLVYMMSRLGYLTLYDVFTAKAIYRGRVTEETVFCAAHYTASGGILAVTRKGQVLQIGLNKSKIVPYLLSHLEDPRLAVEIAGRLGISGAAQMSDQMSAEGNSSKTDRSTDVSEALLVGGYDKNTSTGKTVIIFILFHALYFVFPTMVILAPLIAARVCPAYTLRTVAIWIAYWTYVFLDKSYKNNGAPWKTMENWILVRIILEWLPIRILRTTKLDKDKLYVFACHPHGTLAFSRAAVGFSTRTLWDVAFPEVKFRVLTATAPFFVPFIRELWLWSYCIDAAKATAVKAMRELKASIFVYPGGELEQIETVYQKQIAMVSMRKGFVKLAIEEGAELVPVYTFGETDLYYHSRLLIGLRKWIVKKFHVAIPFLRGQYGLMPYRVPVTMVFGAPMKLIHKSNPTHDEVNEAHAAYCTALRKLFDEHKASLGYADAVLEIR